MIVQPNREAKKYEKRKSTKNPVLFIIIINACLRSHQQMAQQDLPLVSYGFLTGFRGISDLPAPCTFNTGFQPSQSQVGLP